LAVSEETVNTHVLNVLMKFSLQWKEEKWEAAGE
jgi:DNA-binding CsgD family transcriptional regulator